MTFEHIFDHINFNFQVNRILSFGDKACQREEVLQAMKHVTNMESWYKEWRKIAEKACHESRYLHSMYYYRMAEFMLPAHRKEKQDMYNAMQTMFKKAFPQVKIEKVPYKHGYLPCICKRVPNSNHTLVIHGGFDSYIEELYLLVEQLDQNNINIILFEGEGQGDPLRQKLYFHEKWEQSVSAVLNYYELENIILMGMSWGGYFALRAAAYEKRIKHVICHGVLYDAFDVQKRVINQPLRMFFNLLYRLRCKKTINKLAYKKMKLDPLVEWGLLQGMYITHTKSPFEFFQSIEKHNLRKELTKIDQHILLLTGEKDHYIPRWQYNFLKNNLPNALVDSRMFTESEGGEQHCQVGNYELAITHIMNWIKYVTKV